ncbi:MAG: hypothetical protein GXW85_08235 [Clostridia bacterium]|nr:hypothetical protein [Clostridia bacterium]
MGIDIKLNVDGGKVDVKTGDNIFWDAVKMGGMPQPKGVTIFSETDLSEILIINFSYIYSVTGLTKEVYQEYIKLATDKFPKVIENILDEEGGHFLAVTENFENMFGVEFKEGDLSFINYTFINYTH